jgi:WD40 repeat protein
MKRLGFAVLFLLPAAPAARAQDPPAVRGVAFSPDGKRLAAGSGDPKQPGRVTLWDVATRRRLWTHAEKGGVPAVAFSPDGGTLAVGTYAGAARLLDAATGKVQATLAHPREVRAVAFSPDGKRLATACWDGRVRVWDVARAAEVLACKGHQDRVFTVAFSRDGKHLLSAGGDDGVKLWDAATGAEKRTWKHAGFYVPFALFAQDGRWAITAGYDGTTRVWDVASGEPRARLSGTGGVHYLALSPAAGLLAVCGVGRSISLFEMTLRDPTARERERIRELLARLDDDSYDVREAASKELLEVGFLAEAELARAAKEAKSAEVRIRARRLRWEMFSRPRASLRGHTDAVEGVAFSPDGKLMASGGRDGTLRLWGPASGKEVARLLPER